MRIGFDLRSFLKEETGVGVYFKNLLLSLSEIDDTNEYYLFSSSWKDRFHPQKTPPFARKSFRDFRWPVKAVNFFWYRLSWPPLDTFFRINLDLTHSPTPLILPTKGKKIITVHDLFYLDFPHLTDKETRKNLFRKTEKSVRKADGVIVSSQYTESQMLDKYDISKEKIKVIYHGVDPRFSVGITLEEEVKTRERYSLPPSFILFVGTMEPRKNLINLIEALKIVHEQYGSVPLVIIGKKGKDYGNIKERIRKNELESSVRMLDYLQAEELRLIYRLASVFVFPSLCEGFGLPLLEAMATEVPIATSRGSAIPEISKDAALYFEPEDFEDMAEKIILLLRDDSLRQNLIAKGKERIKDFDWRKTATETLEFYHQIVA